MRISDWSSDVCSSDLPGCGCASPTRKKPPARTRKPTRANPIRGPGKITPRKITMLTIDNLHAEVGGKPILTGLSLSVKAGERSEEQTSELQSLMRTPYAVFCLKKKR